MILQNKRQLTILIIVSILLLIPLIAMQLTDEVNWTPVDFVFAGALLSGTGFLIELTIRRVSIRWIRISICAAIIIMLLTIWAELAVGIFH